jgi:hypothetical protein
MRAPLSADHNCKRRATHPFGAGRSMFEAGVQRLPASRTEPGSQRPFTLINIRKSPSNQLQNNQKGVVVLKCDGFETASMDD